MEERRKSFRINKPLLIRLKGADGNNKVVYINNLSEEGLCFISPRQFSEGEEIGLDLKLPSRPQEWHECRAKVLESKDVTSHPGAFLSGFRTRIKFDALSAQAAAYLKEYCLFAAKQNEALERIFQKQLGVLEKEAEKRGGVRIGKVLVAMYSQAQGADSGQWDVTAIRNISVMGALFTTKSAFAQSTPLKIMVRIPLRPFDWLELEGEAIDSKALTSLKEYVIGGSYLTRVSFSDIPAEKKALLEEYVQWFVKRVRDSKEL